MLTLYALPYGRRGNGPIRTETSRQPRRWRHRPEPSPYGLRSRELLFERWVAASMAASDDAGSGAPRERSAQQVRPLRSAPDKRTGQAVRRCLPRFRLD